MCHMVLFWVLFYFHYTHIAFYQISQLSVVFFFNKVGVAAAINVNDDLGN